MINRVLRLSLLFVVLILLQVLVMNNIQFNGYINPYIYLLFILLLPFEIPSWLLLIISFLTGLIIDLFSVSPGMHASATLVAGFIRPHILRILSPRDGYEKGSEPSLHTYGVRWFVTYAAFIILIHHFVLFYLEVFRLSDFFRTFLRVILSSIFSLVFILLIDYYRKRK